MYSSNRYEVTAVFDVVVVEGSLQRSGMCRVTVMKRVLHSLDLIDSDPDVDALLNSCIKGTDVNGHSHIVINALEYLERVLLLRCWTWGGRQQRFSGVTCVTA